MTRREAGLESKTREPSGVGPRLIPFLITLAAVGLAGLLGWAMWAVYTGAPWTRDATVRTYIVTMAPEVSGRIVDLPVTDNRYVHKGDPLMVVDPTNYKIAVSQNKAAVQLAEAGVQNVDAQINVQHAQISASQAQVKSSAGGAGIRAAAGGALPGAWRKKVRAAVQNAQQFTSQLHQQEAALQTAQAEPRADEAAARFALQAQRMSAEADPCASQGAVRVKRR